MTSKKTEKVLYKLPNGETFDAEAAFARHPALITADVLITREDPYDIRFTITVNPWAMSKLVKILDSAPRERQPAKRNRAPAHIQQRDRM